MIAAATIILYLLMVAFDLSVLAGTVWLIIAHDWSVWWFILTIIIMSCSSPRKLILAMHGIDAREES